MWWYQRFWIRKHVRRCDHGAATPLASPARSSDSFFAAQAADVHDLAAAFARVEPRELCERGARVRPQGDSVGGWHGVRPVLCCLFKKIAALKAEARVAFSLCEDASAPHVAVLRAAGVETV